MDQPFPNSAQRHHSEGQKKTTKILLSQENLELRRRAACWEAAGAVASRLVLGQPMDVIMNEAVRECAQALSADLLCVMFLGESGKELEITASVGLDGGMLPSIPIEDGESLETVARRALPVWALPDSFQSPEYIENPLRNSVFQPIQFQETALGVLCVARTPGKPGLSKQEMKVVLSVANQIAMGAFLEGPAKQLMESERLERELHFAHTLKGRILPSDELEIPGCRSSLRYLRSLDCGGDFHDFIPLADGKNAIMVGETSGFGVKAAFNIAQIISSARGYFARLSDLSVIVRLLNDSIVKESRRGQIVSLCIIIVDHENKTLQIARAGNTVALLSCGGVIKELATGSNTPLGVVMGNDSEVCKIPFEDDMALLVTTAGLNKCSAQSGARYDRQQIINVFGELHSQNSDFAIAVTLAGQILRDNQSSVLQEDVTILSLEF